MIGSSINSIDIVMKDSREELKAFIENEIDGLCIRYSLSDVAKRAIKYITD